MRTKTGPLNVEPTGTAGKTNPMGDQRQGNVTKNKLTHHDTFYMRELLKSRFQELCKNRIQRKFRPICVFPTKYSEVIVNFDYMSSVINKKQ